MVEKPKRRWRYGVNRWLILLFIILGFIAARKFPPILPVIQLPAETLSSQPILTLPIFGSIYLTNTMVATLIADVVLIIIALLVYRATRSGALIPKGLSGAMEALLEAINNLTESTAGKWTKKIFPFFATLTLLILIVNWMELLPGVDTIGFIHHAEPGSKGYSVEQVLPNVYTIVQPATIVTETSSSSGHTTGAISAEESGYIITPFVRVASTDLNFTVALALIAVTMTQVFGVRALKLSYFTKFINFKGFGKKNPFFGAIDFFVGLIELVSEFSKLLSFSFRLFGNIFAGSVLLFVMGNLIPVLVPSVFLGLEFFVGIIQAVVFGMLTMIFMSQATQGHEEEHH